MSAPRDDDEVNAASDGEGAVDAQIELLTSLKNPELNALVDAHKASSSAATAATAPVTTPAPSAAPLASAAAAIRAAASTAPGGAAAPSSSSTKASKHKALTIAMGGGHSLEEAEQLDASHRFWSTQPVPHMADRGGGEQHRPLEGPTADVRAEPSRLPAGFEWTVIDVTSDAQLLEMYKLLENNYVEDDDAMFRFAYPLAFLKWGLTPPHFVRDWHVGVRIIKSRRLVACITGVPATLNLYGRAIRICEINYLCVDKRLRSNRLAPVLIKEVTRRVNLCGVWQAAYTAGVVLPTPVASCRYWHRPIDPKKLIEIRFSRLPANMTMARVQQHNKLPPLTRTTNIRALTEKDVPSATLALNAYLAKFAMHPAMNEDELQHWLLPRKDVIDTFVVDVRMTRAAARAHTARLVAEISGRRAAWMADSAGATGGGGGTSENTAVSGLGSSAAVEGVAASGAGGAGAVALRALDDAYFSALAEKIVGAGADDDEIEVVTDLISFYHLPSSVIGHSRHTHLYAGYLYYYVTDTVPFAQLVEDALILARNVGIDVFNCLDLMQNQDVIQLHKFQQGDGNLQYYVFNWRCPQMTGKDVGLVLH